MKSCKIIVIIGAAMLLATMSWAGNTPEYDAVGNDSAIYFAAVDLKLPFVVGGNVGPNGPVNALSSFPAEEFRNTAGQLFPDPCFPGYVSALTDAWNEAIYEWTIVLQMKPESDINLAIHDCVLKHNGSDLFFDAEQTGRYRADWGQLFFVPTANPVISAEARPGPFATPGFTTPFILDARSIPGLVIDALDAASYTSKALWEESIVMVLPETGTTNSSGQTVYNLKQGDRIHVRVAIPFNNTADIRYGQDTVILKYIGIVGTWYYGNA